MPQLKTEEEKEEECSIISAKSPERELLICVYSSDDTGMFGEVCDKILLLKFVDLVLMYWEGGCLGSYLAETYLQTQDKTFAQSAGTYKQLFRKPSFDSVNIKSLILMHG